MEINHLRVFYEVAKVGRFTEAANRLNISQSALSRSVALLEESEGVQLFERSKTGVKLTPLGTEVFIRCEELFKKFRDIEDVCRGKKEVCEGPLRLATADHVTNDILIQPMQRFLNDFPLVTPSVFIGIPDEIIQNLLYTECEFALLFVKVPLPQVDYQIIRPEMMALVCNPKVWKRNKQASTSKTLKKTIEDIGYLASPGARSQSRPSRVLMELFGEMPRISIETNSQEAQKRFCLAGAGVAYLQRFMVEAEIRRGELFEIPLENLHSFNLWLATRKGRQLSLAARTFLQYI